MFFQPKFHRGTRSAAPPKARSGSLPLLHYQQGASSQREAFNQTSKRDTYLSSEDDCRVLPLSDRPKSESEHLQDQETAREDYFDQRYRINTAQESSSRPIQADRPPLSTSSQIPLSPLSRPHILPTINTPPDLPRTPQYHPYSVHHGHGTTPSFSSNTSNSSSSHQSFNSDSLLTPIRSYLHVPISPTSSIAPSRPLPPPPKEIDLGSGRIQNPSPACQKRFKPLNAPPPPPSMSVYASMPLPPLPASSFTSKSRSPPPASPSVRAKRSNRDSQATVRPSDIQFRSRSRHTHYRELRPSLPLSSALQETDKDQDVHIRVYGDKEEEESEMPDLSLLSVFPMPPSRPSSPFMKGIRKISEGETDLRSKRLSSKSTIKPIRRAPPPPLPLLRFDLFSLDSEISEDGVRMKISEADRIREQYLRGRRRT